MNKDGNMKDWIWVQMMDLNTPIEKKTTEEVRSRDPKTPQDKILKNHGFKALLTRTIFPWSLALVNYLMRLENLLLNKTEEMRIRTLTRPPPLHFRYISTLLPLTRSFLGSHPHKISFCCHVRGLMVISFSSKGHKNRSKGMPSKGGGSQLNKEAY